MAVTSLPFQSVLLQKLQMTYEQCTLGSERKHLSARYLMDHFMVNRWCSKYANFHGYFNYGFDGYGLVYFIHLPNMHKRPEIFFTLIFTLQSLNLWKSIKCVSFPMRLRTKGSDIPKICNIRLQYLKFEILDWFE